MTDTLKSNIIALDRTRVTVIIPTMCERARRASLLHAIESVVSQEAVTTELIVVVNGERFDPELLAQLRADPRLRVEYRAEPSAPGAQRHGRTLVKSEYFAFLDDDDEFLPGALKARVDAMDAHQTVSLVVTNGYFGTNKQRYVDDGDGINRDPFAALVRSNWLASCAGLYRSAGIGTEYFNNNRKFLEWTLLAFRILNDGHKVLFIDTMTYQINDSPISLSKSLEYQGGSAEFISYLIALKPPARIQAALRRKLTDAWHDLSDHYLRVGDKANAWRCHLRSLVGPGGLRYLLYTRRFLFRQAPI